jgi:YhcH/YjgK/YiaL family protein
MFIDSLANTAVTDALPPRLKRAVEYLRTTDLSTLAAGRFDVDGDRIFALLQDYTTRPAAETKWEAHRRHIDVQCVLAGSERMGYQHLSRATVTEPYDPDRDVAFFQPGTDFLTVSAGMYAIFWPDDVHAPQGAAGEPASVRKVVVKVLVE